MKKVLALLLLISASAAGYAQSSAQRFYTALFPNPQGQNFVQVIPNASVYVCVYNPQKQCNTPQGIYSDSDLTQPIVQPLLADGSGVYSYYIQSGSRIIEKVCAPYNQCSSYEVQIGDRGGSSGAGGCITLSEPGELQVSNGTGGCSPTWVQVNGTNLVGNNLLTTPINFVNSNSVTFTNTVGGTISATAANALLIEHNDSSTGINQAVLDFNDATPASPSNALQLTFQTDSSGRVSGYTPFQTTYEHNGNYVGINQRIWNANDTFPAAPFGYSNVIFSHDEATGSWAGFYSTLVSPNIQMQVKPPIAGNYVVVYPKNGAITFDPPGNSSIFANGNTAAGGYFEWQCVGILCSIAGDVQAHWYNFSLPAGLDPATVTAVYADAITSAEQVNTVWGYTDSYSGTNLTCNGVQLMVSQTTFPYAATEQSGLTGLTGANFNSTAACSIQVGGSGPGAFGQAVHVPAVRFLVFYSGPALPVSTGVTYVQPPLGVLVDQTHNNNTLYLDQSDLPAGHIIPLNVVLPPATVDNEKFIYPFPFAASESDCTAGGVGAGTYAHFCWNPNGTGWVRFGSVPGGGSGTVTNVATDSTSGISGGPITTTGTISCLQGSSSQFGCLKVDGTTITATAGVISAIGSGGSATVASAEVVAFSATPTFSTARNVSRIVLTGNITSFTMSGAADGQSKTLCFKQGAGPYTVAAPASVHGFFTIGTINGDWNCQSFVWDNTDSIWQSVGPGTINQ